MMSLFSFIVEKRLPIFYILLGNAQFLCILHKIDEILSKLVSFLICLIFKRVFLVGSIATVIKISSQEEPQLLITER